MKQLITYSIWTFIAAALLKSGLDILLDERIGYLPVIIFTIFTHVSITFPIMVAINILAIKNENR